MNPADAPLCECGCGEQVKTWYPAGRCWARWKHGHSSRRGRGDTGAAPAAARPGGTRPTPDRVAPPA